MAKLHLSFLAVFPIVELITHTNGFELPERMEEPQTSDLYRRGDIRISYGLIQARRSDAHSKMEERIGLISRLLIQANSLSELSGGIIPMSIKATTQRNLGVHKASSHLRNEENTVTHTELLLSSQQRRVTM
ncbi:hypothetical protein BLNAU_20479 [Blattamonas nauphoetae]|uniref:Uncharacterized protein n=1 Tax=Blattamonas nauphoetae TaxID=2049346 RepID=A0ABQ9X2U3_9EUKA|nr:hypothetical protein BLNAU_20479 [Blattamonas nauphoetae]